MELFIAIIIYILYKNYKSGKFDSLKTGINKSIQKNVEQQSFLQKEKLSYSEQEELKKRIKERIKNPNPKQMPNQSKIFTSEEIDNYHNALDICGKDDCDINLGFEGKFYQENCNIENCDIDNDLQVGEVNSSKDNFSIGYQLIIADAILNRKGQ